MPFTIVSADDTDGIEFASGDSITVLADVTVSTTDGFGSALELTSASFIDTNLTILGTLVSAGNGIDAIDSVSEGGTVSGNSIYVGETGAIFAGGFGIGLGFETGTPGNSVSPILNHGEIFATGSAVVIAGGFAGPESGAFNIENHGSMSAVEFDTVQLNSGNTGTITNTGLMSNSGGAAVISFGLVEDEGLSGPQSGPSAMPVFSPFGITINNSGTITSNGALAINGGGFASVINTGTINGGIQLDGFGATIVNQGLINGAIQTGGGFDVYDGLGGGIVLGSINLGGGDDVAQLGNQGGLVFGGEGEDELFGGTFADALFGEDDEDLIRGGMGDDYIEGGENADTLRGGQGEDEIYGGSGFDSIRGGADDDYIEGGMGSDTMTGGAGADVFAFTSTSESTNDAFRDVITDFTAGEDVIDLSELGFLTFVGDMPFSGTAGEVMVMDPNAIGRVKIFVDQDGDGTADMKIILSDVEVPLTEDDFWLAEMPMYV